MAASKLACTQSVLSIRAAYKSFRKIRTKTSVLARIINIIYKTKDCPDGSKKDSGFVLPEIDSLYCQFGTSRREIQIFDMFLPIEAPRGIRSKKLLNAVQRRIKFCIV